MPLHTDAPIEIVDRVVIAGGPARRQRGTPTMVQLPNGDLLLGYRLGVGRDRMPNGVLMLTRSADEGRTWDEPIPFYAMPGWDCCGLSGLRLLPDGSLILFAARMRLTPVGGMVSKISETHTYLSRSIDNGHTWSEFEPEINVFPAITEFWGHGPIMQFADGRLILGVIGTQFEYERWASAVVFSSDDCRSFHDLTIIADTPGYDFCDNDFIRLDDGRLLAVIRTEQPPFEMYQSYSADDGRTWTPVQPCGFKAGGPALWRLRSGAILCVYRDREPGRPGVACSVTEDDGQTWRYLGQLYEGTHWHCGYPDIVQLPDGRLFCSYYTSLDDGNSEVQGVYLRDRT